jgi:cbb3-type cytochrome c oxidase subunit III
MRLLLIVASLLILAGIAGAQDAGDLAKQGRQVFEDNCAQCHRDNGQGLPGTFPALDANPFVVGDAKPVMVTILKGRKGQMGQMPTWKDKLDDQQVAGVVTYIRQAWSNRGAAVTPAMVTAARSK